ncbi:MAG: hypothetical protein NZM08_09140 [Chitinophagales bacterium]|nr:hypothetical protein [Chitinophagales bacterium]
MATVLSLAVFSLSLFGQTLPVEEIDVVKQYRPQLTEAEKIQSRAEAPPRDTTLYPITYPPFSLQLPLPFTPADVKPLAVPKPKEEPLQNHLFGAGFGTQLWPQLALYLSNGRSSSVHYGLQTRYESSTAAQMPLQKFSRWDARLHGTSFFQKVALWGEVDFDRNAYRYYAFPANYELTAEFPDEDSLRSVLFGAGIRLGVYNSAPTAADLDYDVQLRYRHLEQQARLMQSDSLLFSSWDPREDEVDLQATIRKKISEEQVVQVHATYQNVGYRMPQTDTALSLLTLTPAYVHAFRSLNLFAGLTAFAGNDLFTVFPALELSYRIAGDMLSVFGRLERRMDVQTFQKTMEENPYVIFFNPFTSKSTDAVAGIAGVYGQQMTYRLFVRQSWWKHQAFFYPFYQEPVYYRVEAHPAGSTLALAGEVTYRMSQRLAVLLSGNISRWKPDSLEHPVGIAPQSGKIGVEYQMKDKIRLDATVYAQTGAFTVTPEGESLRLKGFIDPNLKITYNYRPHLAFWAAGYNLANMKQRQWYGYTSYGIRAAAGVWIKF